MAITTTQISTVEMQAYIARFAAGGASQVPLMAPEGLRTHAGAPVKALPGLAVAVEELAAGESSKTVRYTGRVLHVMCYEGSFDFSWGPKVGRKATLRRFDLISVPRDVLHSFKNTSGHAGRLIVVTQIDRAADDAVFHEGGMDLPEMGTRISRAKDRIPYQKSLQGSGGVPSEVMRYMAASRVYPIVAPPNLTGRNQNAPLKGLPGATVSLAECDAGDGPQPHAHVDTYEIFLCLEGRFDIVWGDRNEHRITLEPLDLVAVPPKVMRIFKNVSDGIGRLMVIIQGADDMADSIASFPELAADVEKRFGAEAVEAIKRVVKQSFDAIPGSRA